MRLFIAIDFSELKDYFRGIQNLLPKDGKLSLVKTFHLTLKFLGELQQNSADDVINILKGIRFKPFSLFIDSIGIFPTENYIRVIWVGIKPEENLLELQRNIDESLKGMFKKEKEFKPHITLARVKYPKDKKDFLRQLKNIKVENKEVKVNNFKLINSISTPKGAVYWDLEIYSLTKI